ncbi:MAG: AMP-binding protein [Palaeococcus sp.]|nr:AMP-binding protein [Palaeococcus sp. (in: euryarchaeotes)]
MLFGEPLKWREGELKYTIKKAVETSEFWRKRFNESVESFSVEELLLSMKNIRIIPKDLYNIEEVWPSYIKNKSVFHTILKTSGTTGKSKLIPFTMDDKKRLARQFDPWVEEYVEDGDVIASFFPPLPSASGMMGFGAFEIMMPRVRYVQMPLQLLRMKELLIRELEEISPTWFFCLTTTAYNLGFMLPEGMREDVRLLLVGGETLTDEMAQATLENFPNATIIDAYGCSEDGAPAYRVVKKGKTGEFKMPHSILTLTPNEGEYYDVHITKVMMEGELTGLPIFNYAIGDLARVENGKIKNIIRIKDVVSLAGAKLFLDQVMSIVFEYPFLKDFVMLYYPLSRKNPRPKAVIRVGYEGRKPSGIEEEIRERIYEGNNPVRYEVEDSKQAELVIEAVPIDEVRKGLPQKPGKTKRIFIAGIDI